MFPPLQPIIVFSCINKFLKLKGISFNGNPTKKIMPPSEFPGIQFLEISEDIFKESSFPTQSKTTSYLLLI